MNCSISEYIIKGGLASYENRGLLSEKKGNSCVLLILTLSFTTEYYKYIFIKTQKYSSLGCRLFHLLSSLVIAAVRLVHYTSTSFESWVVFWFRLPGPLLCSPKLQRRGYFHALSRISERRRTNFRLSLVVQNQYRHGFSFLDLLGTNMRNTTTNVSLMSTVCSPEGA